MVLAITYYVSKQSENVRTIISSTKTQKWEKLDEKEFSENKRNCWGSNYNGWTSKHW